jgi:ribosomal-protein-alanine N-acetyltransferase
VGAEGFPPVLRTERLRLRPMSPADAPAMAAYASDPELSAQMHWEPHRGPADALAFIEGLVLPAYAKGVPRAWAICEGDREPLVGTIGLEWSSEKDKCMALGYVLSKACWGKGYATEAGRAVVAWAFPVLGLERLAAVCTTENPRSGNVLKKIGLRYEGTLRASSLIKGRFRDMELYARVKADGPLG